MKKGQINPRILYLMVGGFTIGYSINGFNGAIIGAIIGFIISYVPEKAVQ